MKTKIIWTVRRWDWDATSETYEPQITEYRVEAAARAAFNAVPVSLNTPQVDLDRDGQTVERREAWYNHNSEIIERRYFYRG